MNIVFFAHPALLGSQSMPRFLNMLAGGMQRRGHRVRVLQPDECASRLPAPSFVRKWLGYFDAYVLFPVTARREINRCPPDTLFVFADQALGMWFDLTAGRPHVIHCHDFLAQRSARNEISRNPVSWTGRMYQQIIHRGYAQGRNFISVSFHTRSDLHSFLDNVPERSVVIYNGLNQTFAPRDPMMSRMNLGEHLGVNLLGGYILHVGGNQWYKNRCGVIDIYDTWRNVTHNPLPLLLVGKTPDRRTKDRWMSSPYKSDVCWAENLPDRLLCDAYAGANVLLFPSLAEGFGWPIAEAMACGCPVITTNAPPMTEVAGNAGFLIPSMPDSSAEVRIWAGEVAQTLNTVLNLEPHVRARVIRTGLANAKRFDTERSLDRIEAFYQSVSHGLPSPTMEPLAFSLEEPRMVEKL